MPRQSVADLLSEAGQEAPVVPAVLPSRPAPLAAAEGAPAPAPPKAPARTRRAPGRERPGPHRNPALPE